MVICICSAYTQLLSKIDDLHRDYEDEKKDV